MSVKKRIVSITLIIFLVLISGCGPKTSSNFTKSPIGNKEDISSSPTENPTETIAPTKSQDKSADIKKEEALKVITDYFTAAKEHDSKDPLQYVTDRLKHGSFSNLKDAKIISTEDDVGNKMRSEYSMGMGLESNPYDVICFKVTYNFQLIDDKKSSEPSGDRTKWFILIKETESSPWLIDEIGY